MRQGPKNKSKLTEQDNHLFCVCDMLVSSLLQVWEEKHHLLNAHSITVDSKAGGELVSNMDTMIEDWLQSRLRKEYPSYQFIGEESASRWPPSNDNCFLVDPLDGTHNFLAGFPTFGTIVTLIENREVVLCAIILPIRHYLTNRGIYVAIRNHGAWEYGTTPLRKLRGYQKMIPIRRLSISNCSAIEQSLLIVEQTSASLSTEPSFIQTLRQKSWRHRSNIGSAWAIVTLADSGALPKGPDIMIARTTPWDTLGGCLMVEEAGGIARSFSDQPYSLDNYRDMILTNPVLYRQVQNIIT